MDWVHRTRVADGRAVLIRRALHADEACIQRFMQSLSTQSRYQRFFHPLRELTPAMVATILQPDESRGCALLAFASPAHGEVVGLAQYEVVEPRQAEVAVIVGENWRRVGLATRLLSDIGMIAAAAGIADAYADILRDNAAALMLARQLGCVVDTSSRAPYTLRVTRQMTLLLPSRQSVELSLAKS